MKKLKTYFVLKNNKIIKIYRTTQGQDGILKSLQFESITDYDEIREVINNHEAVQGMNIRELDENYKIRPEEIRIIEGLIPVPKGKKIKDNKLIDKTTFEKIQDREIILNPYQIYDEATDSIRTKTFEEMYSPEELAHIEEEKLIQEEIRKIAIERLKQAKIL